MPPGQHCHFPTQFLIFRRFHRNPAVLNWIVVCSWQFGHLRNRRAAGRVQHRFDDIVVAGAAADAAFQLVADGCLVQLVAVAVHDIDRRHDHAWSATAALRAKIAAEGGLHRVQLVALGDAPDCGDIGAGGLSDQRGAGVDRPAVDMDGASAALPGVAADMCPGQIEIFAQQMDIGYPAAGETQANSIRVPPGSRTIKCTLEPLPDRSGANSMMVPGHAATRSCKASSALRSATFNAR